MMVKVEDDLEWVKGGENTTKIKYSYIYFVDLYWVLIWHCYQRLNYGPGVSKFLLKNKIM